MRTNVLTTLLALPLLLAASAAWGQEAKSETSASVGVGAYHAEDSGSLDRVHEYTPDKSGPELLLRLEETAPSSHFLLSAHTLGGTTQNVTLDFDASRMLHSHTTYTKFIHRLPHNPLSYMDAVAPPKVLQGTDLSPDDAYKVTYSLLESGLTFQHPDIPRLTLGLLFRDQHRDGNHQSLTLGHCSGCHVYGQTRPVDEHTYDIGFKASLDLTRAVVTLPYEERSLTQGTDSVYLRYPRGIHPVLRTAIFSNRFQYDYQNGILPANLLPEMDKRTTRLDLSAPDLKGFSLDLGGAWSNTENRRTGISYDYEGYRFATARRFGDQKRWSFRWRSTYYTLDSSDFFVDTL